MRNTAVNILIVPQNFIPEGRDFWNYSTELPIYFCSYLGLQIHISWEMYPASNYKFKYIVARFLWWWLLHNCLTIAPRITSTPFYSRNLAQFEWIFSVWLYKFVQCYFLPLACEGRIRFFSLLSILDSITEMHELHSMTKTFIGATAKKHVPYLESNETRRWTFDLFIDYRRCFQG